jgi:hypothetical protein
MTIRIAQRNETEIDCDRNYVLFDVKSKKVIAEIKCIKRIKVVIKDYCEGT